LKKISKDFGLPPAEVTEDGLQVLIRHDWPGNIRELEATLRNALLFAKGKPLDRKLLMAQESLERPHESSTAFRPEAGRGRRPRGEGGARDDLNALRRANTDKKAAAKELGISLRTLYSRMDWHRIPKKKPCWRSMWD
jgi:DNA-binding NtrC family response regulator